MHYKDLYAYKIVCVYRKIIDAMQISWWTWNESYNFSVTKYK